MCFFTARAHTGHSRGLLTALRVVRSRIVPARRTGGRSGLNMHARFWEKRWLSRSRTSWSRPENDGDHLIHEGKDACYIDVRAISSLFMTASHHNFTWLRIAF